MTVSPTRNVVRVTAAIVLFFASSRLIAQNYTIRGTVSSAEGPVAGASSVFRAVGQTTTLASAVTASDGTFSVSVPAGRVDWTVEPPPGRPLLTRHAGAFDVRKDLEVRCTLERPTSISGIALGPDRQPVAALGLNVISLTDGEFRTVPWDDSAFNVQVPPGVYAIHTRAAGLQPGYVVADTRNGNVSGVELVLESNPKPILPLTPPRASRIAISAADADGVAMVTGAPGAVLPKSSVLVINLGTLQMNITASDATGAFSVPITAPPGAFLLVKHDPTGLFLAFDPRRGGGPINDAPPGTILQVPLPAGPGIPFSASDCIDFYGAFVENVVPYMTQFVGALDGGWWRIDGSTDPAQWQPGSTIDLVTKLTIASRDLDGVADISQIRFSARIALEKVIDAAGRQQHISHTYSSSLMTPTGLPIERLGTFGPSVISDITDGEQMRLAAPGRIEGTWRNRVTIPASLPPGIYRPVLYVAQVNGMPAKRRHFDLFPLREGIGNSASALPLFRVGSVTPRLSWAILLNDVANGNRGAVAVEDRGRFAPTSHIRIPAGPLILPIENARTGRRLQYRLEPFAPLISSSIERVPIHPQIPLKFPSGSLSVRVTRPDGVVENLGSAPFVQAACRTPVTDSGASLSGAYGVVTNHVSDYYELTTLDPRFEYTFPQYGAYRIVVEGTVDDIYGNTYHGGGIYEVIAARPLHIETAVLPGTPFERNNVAAPMVVIRPPVPADVEVTVRHLPDSDPARAETTIIRGRANRFGFFSPADAVLMSEPGEYRMDVQVRYLSPSGVLWAAAETWGSIVESSTNTLITHGRRGLDALPYIPAQWFVEKTLTDKGDGHIMTPFHTGDVVWMAKEPIAVGPKASIQDVEGSFAQRVRNRVRGPDEHESPGLEERITAGEIPLVTTTSTGESPSFAPDRIDQWGYFYAFVERPGIHIREMITEDTSGAGYWRFRDRYALQLGNGEKSDQPNDFKFQFNGAVYRDHNDGFRYYGSHASLFVLLPPDDEDGSRVFPPFQGNGSGPSGGPLFRLKGKEIELFFHPTGVRPGTILQHGERVSFAGYSAPPLASKLEISITSPSGRVRTIRGRANRIGYFLDRSQDFTADEEGVWRARVTITFDGVLPSTSGQVQQPYPTGDLLGSREGEFYFYVVRADTPQLEVSVSGTPLFVRPADGPITFTITPPSGLTNIETYTTTTMPGFVLEEGVTTSLRYTYDASRLARDFPNLDLHDEDGLAGADAITISFLLSGTDSTGTRRFFARQVVIQGEELQMPEQKPVPPRRHSVRH